MAASIRQQSPATTTPYGANTTSHQVSFASLPLAGNTVVVVITKQDTDSGNPTLVSDNQGGSSYSTATSTGANSACYIYYRKNISSPSGTFTVTIDWAASAYASVGIAELAGVSSDPLGAVGTNSGTATGADSVITTGNLDPSGAAIYIGACVDVQFTSSADNGTGTNDWVLVLDRG